MVLLMQACRTASEVAFILEVRVRKDVLQNVSTVPQEQGTVVRIVAKVIASLD